MKGFCFLESRGAKISDDNLPPPQTLMLLRTKAAAELPVGTRLQK